MIPVSSDKKELDAKTALRESEQRAKQINQNWVEIRKATDSLQKVVDSIRAKSTPRSAS